MRARCLPSHARRAIAIQVIVGLFGFSAVGNATAKKPKQHSADPSPWVESVSNPKLSFEINRGQIESRVKFLSRGKGYTLYLTADEAVLALRAASPVSNRDDRRRISMRLVGARTPGEIVGLGELPGKINYFVGQDPLRWRTNISTYAGVVYRDVYDGIDLVYHGHQDHLEYDFVLSPGADPNIIRLTFAGVREQTIDLQGDLVLRISDGELRVRKPRVYQMAGDVRRDVEATYAIDTATSQVRFIVSPYDSSKPLIIDPVVVYSTYLGGSAGDLGLGVATDVSGNVYVSGRSESVDFPTAGAFQSINAGGGDVFVTKIDPAGALVYSTFLGGSGFEQGHALAVDSVGNAFVVGTTTSSDFPTANAFQPSKAGTGATTDAFVTAINPAGSGIVFSTYLGGGLADFANGVAVDGSGVHLTGLTQSSDFPVVNAFQPTKSAGIDAFVAKLSLSGTSLTYSTFLGGTGRDEGFGIALDASGTAYVAGQTESANFPVANAFQSVPGGGGEDGFATKFSSSGSLLYSTYLGGNDQDAARGIVVDGLGAAHITGYTRSTNFPTFNPIQPAPTNGFRDVFLVELAPAGTTLAFSTCLGGSDHDEGFGVAIDSSGNRYIAGYTESTDFPTVAPIQASFGGSRDVFLSKVDASGTALTYSTYLGGSDFESIEQQGVAVDASGAAHVVGYTSSTDFPTSAALQPFAAGGFDAFVAKIGDVPPDEPTTLISLDPANLWIGLINGDDQGTRFDLRAEVLKNGSVVASGLTRCISGVTRNPNKALQALVSFDAFAPVTYDSGDTFSLRVLTRIGTNPNDTKCPGHNNAVGLRLYYDATHRQSRFGAELAPDPPESFFLHSAGATDFLDDAAPTATTALFKDSSGLSFPGGNPWSAIGIWSMTIP